ncbi:MAG: hypothetical protein NTV75_03775 [Bacteroidia bacterium]|nr:hypothetical protein [Bacteroidia bacterium]
MMDYTQFAGQKVRIASIDTPLYEGRVWGFQFEDETEAVVLEVWTEDFTFPVEDILSIEVCQE